MVEVTSDENVEPVPAEPSKEATRGGIAKIFADEDETEPSTPQPQRSQVQRLLEVRHKSWKVAIGPVVESDAVKFLSFPLTSVFLNVARGAILAQPFIAQPLTLSSQSRTLC